MTNIATNQELSGKIKKLVCDTKHLILCFSTFSQTINVDPLIFHNVQCKTANGSNQIHGRKQDTSFEYLMKSIKI